MGAPLQIRDQITIMLLFFGAISSFIIIIILLLFPNLNPLLKAGFLAWIFCVAFLFIPVISMIIDGNKGLFVGLVLYIILFVVYKLIFKGIPFSWLLCTTILFTVITFGGMTIEALKRKTMLAYGDKGTIQISGQCIGDLDAFFRFQQTAYFAVPLGFISGIIATAFLKLNSFEVLILSVKITLILGILFLTIILIKSFLIAFKSFIKYRNNGVTVPHLFIPSLQDKHDTPFDLGALSDETKIDIGIAITEIRKIYLYYNLLNGIIFSSLIFMLLHMLNIKIENYYVLLLFLIITFLSSQLPYTLGQYKTQSVILATKKGMQKKDLEEKVQKYLPLLPRFTLLVSLGSGFAGGLVFKLLDEVLKGFTKIST